MVQVTMLGTLRTALLICSLMHLVNCRKFRIAWLSPGTENGRTVNAETSVNAFKLALSSVAANPNIMNGHQIE